MLSRRLIPLLLTLGVGGPVWVAAQTTTPTPAPATTPAPANPAIPATEPVPAPLPSPAAQDDPAAVDAPTEHEKAGHCVEGLAQTCMQLSREGKDGKERRILVIRTGTTDETGIFAICGPRDNDPEGTPNIGVFSESSPSGIRITIDKNVIRVPLAQVTQKPPRDGEEGSDGSIEASAGTARLLDQTPEGARSQIELCAIDVQPKPAPNTVFVTQGKTHLKGQKLVYDEVDGIARIDGPISFERDNEKDPLSGTSDHIDVNVDEESTTLIGNVVLTSKGGRVSKAARVEYDDTANTARLFGTPEQPAESRKGRDVLTVTQGSILYNLDTNDVVVSKAEDGNVTGEFQDGDADQEKP